MPNETYIEALRQAGNLNNKILDVPPYDIIKHLRDSPIMGPGGQVNTNAIKDSAAVALGMLGTGASMPVMSNAAGAFRSSVARGSVGSRRPSSLSDEMMTTLGRLNKRFEGVWGKDKLILNEFHQIYPDAKKLPIKDEGIIRAMHRQESQGGLKEINPTIGEKTPVPDALSNKFVWTPEAKNHLMGLNQNYPPEMMGRDRLIHDKFLEQYPNYSGKSSHLDSMLSKIQNESGGSTTLGSNFGNFGERPPGGPPKPRLNTEGYGEALGSLRAKGEVNTDYVLDWLKGAGLKPARINQTPDSNYVHVKDLAGENVKIRIPTDPKRHHGQPPKEHEVGSYFDTGYGKSNQRWDERSLINESAMPYNKEALGEVLKWRLSNAPHGQNWLVSEDMAPRLAQTDKTLTQPASVPPDPNQLKLLSPGGGYTTQDIINLLKQKNQDGIVNPQET